jgi:hypothetical protein
MNHSGIYGSTTRPKPIARPYSGCLERLSKKRYRQAQVADVARAMGIASGTIYLYALSRRSGCKSRY